MRKNPANRNYSRSQDKELAKIYVDQDLEINYSNLPFCLLCKVFGFSQVLQGMLSFLQMSFAQTNSKNDWRAENSWSEKQETLTPQESWMLSLKRIHWLENDKYWLEGYKNNRSSEKKMRDQFFQTKSEAIQLNVCFAIHWRKSEILWLCKKLDIWQEL